MTFQPEIKPGGISGSTDERKKEAQVPRLYMEGLPPEGLLWRPYRRQVAYFSKTTGIMIGRRRVSLNRNFLAVSLILETKGISGLIKAQASVEVIGGIDTASTNAGSIFNPMTEAQMNSLSTPPNGYLCYNTTRLQYCQYNGNSWGPFTTGGFVRVEVGTTYTIVEADNGAFITLDNAGAITLTLNTGLTSHFHCQIFQKGAGQVTLAGTATLKNFNSHTKLAGINAAAALQNYGIADVYSFQGETVL